MSPCGRGNGNPSAGAYLWQGRSTAALGMPVRCEQLRCFPQGYATVLFPNNITSVMFKFIPNLVYLASVSQRNRV